MSVSIAMGSQSDMSIMLYGIDILEELEIPYEVNIISAHRTPERLYQYAKSAHKRDIKVIIAAAGGAAHLPGMIASMTHLPVLGVPIASENSIKGIDSLLSIVQMPGGVPVGTLAIGKAGAKNAVLLAGSILALLDDRINRNLIEWRQKQTDSVSLQPE